MIFIVRRLFLFLLSEIATPFSLGNGRPPYENISNAPLYASFPKRLFSKMSLMMCQNLLSISRNAPAYNKKEDSNMLRKEKRC